MKNPSRTLGLAPKPLSAVIVHRDADIAESEGKRWFKYEVLQKSPFFRTTPSDHFKFQIITGGPRTSQGLGSDVIYYQIGSYNCRLR